MILEENLSPDLDIEGDEDNNGTITINSAIIDEKEVASDAIGEMFEDTPIKVPLHENVANMVKAVILTIRGDEECNEMHIMTYRKLRYFTIVAIVGKPFVDKLRFCHFAKIEFGT
ncbi:hypothetical protein Glove_372g19 [Diversispora epigaea]|uniref:Uncharacterized protein n=1 Tax=Diversispora epigaea TaxID=1348612 RepID=A0A397H6A2_9GLOM|nr:hypothetical protein Glove_372g19 [Diversispora epigaea]